MILSFLLLYFVIVCVLIWFINVYYIVYIYGYYFVFVFFIWLNLVIKLSLFVKYFYINCINIMKFVISVENCKKGRKCIFRKSNVNEYCIYFKIFFWRIVISWIMVLVKFWGRGIVFWWICLFLVGGSLYLYWCL